MTPAAKRRAVSEDDYFHLLEESDLKLEYFQGVVEAMAGASPEHCRIESNLFGKIFSRLDPQKCEAFTGNQAISIPRWKTYVFADVTVTCGQAEFVQKRGIGCLLNPVTIVEVISPNTSVRDEGEKFLAYTAVRSLREYLIVYPDRYCVKLHQRAHADEIWKTSIFGQGGDEFELTSCGVRLTVRDVYGPQVRFGEEG